MPIIGKETDAWAALQNGQKSRFVRALHFFHFRPNQLARSWKREEVITWELLAALQILPRAFFLGDLLKRIALRAPDVKEICSSLLHGLHTIEIEEYPSLELLGKFRNRKSDIGFRLYDSPRLWLEAKTISVTPTTLLPQLADQKAALKSLCAGKPHAVIALLPQSQTSIDWPTIHWKSVVASLDFCIKSLEATDINYSRGYIEIAKELKNRIYSHPEKINNETTIVI